MRDSDGTERESLAAQYALFQDAAADHNLSLTVLAAETGIDRRVLATYAHSNPFARAKMPLWVFRALCRVIPDDASSGCLPDGKCVATIEEGDGDLDALGREAAGFVSDKLDAEADGHVDHIERARLKRRAARMAPIAHRVAA